MRVDENVPLPAVVVAHHITYDGHPDSYPLHIASKVLSDGQSSRIYRKLVYEQQLALAAFGQGNIIEDPNLFYAVAIVQRGRAPDEATKALIAELDRLKTEPISAAELQRAKNQFARDYILSRESNKEKAQQLAHAAVIHDDITTADGEFEIFQNITAADVQRVAQNVLHAGEPAGHHPHAEGVGQRQGAAAVTVRMRTVASASFAAVARPGPGRAAPGAGRGLAVGGGAAAAGRARREVSAVPGPDAGQRPAGRRGAHHEQPAVSLRLIVRAGGAQDPADKSGVATLVAALLDQGTTHEGRRADRDVDRLDRRRSWAPARAAISPSSTWS